MELNGGIEMNEKIEQIADALDWDISNVTENTRLDELQWDSMAMLTVIAVARANGKTISGAEVREMETVGDLIALI